MVSDKFKLNFNFTFNVVFLVILLLASIVWADNNGVWHNAEDIRGGTFALDETGVTSYFRFINRVQFDSEILANGVVNLTNDTYYKNVELDLRYVNENQANSINSNMLIDGSIGSSDVNSSQIATRSYVDSISLSNVNCPINQYVKGFYPNGSIICNYIFAVCGSSNGGYFYSQPTTNLCNVGIYQDLSDTSTELKWKCLGINSKADDLCVANKKIDCIGYWSDTSTCSATCGGGVKQQIYTITTPTQNGGNSCPSSNGATRWGTTSCNTQSCFGTSFVGRSVSFSHYMKHDASSDAVGYSYATCTGQVGRIVCDVSYSATSAWNARLILDASHSSASGGIVTAWISGNTVYVRHTTAYNTYTDTWS